MTKYEDSILSNVSLLAMILEDHILLKHIENTASVKEAELVDAWMRESLDNRKHYQRLLTVYYESKHLKTFKALDVDAEWNDFISNKVVFHEPIENSLPHRKIFLYATAASLILISAFLFIINADNTISRSATDKLVSFKLPDNTAVTLFPNSSIDYSEDFSLETERIVYVAGKVRFNVIPNSKSPFLVESKLITTKVLGTVFTVNTYNPMVPSVNVEQGTVSVIEKEERSNVRILKKGDSVVFTNGDFLDVLSTPIFKKAIAPVIPKKKKPKKKKKKPVIAKPQPKPQQKAPQPKKVIPEEPKLSSYTVNHVLEFLDKKHEKFSKSRRAKMKDDDIISLNLNMSLDEILDIFKKEYNLELEEGKCEGCVKLKKISKK